MELSDPASALDLVRRLFHHCAWADAALLATLEALEVPPAQAVREYAHVIGAEETWLARLEGRAARSSVWPDLSVAELAALSQETRTGFVAFLGALHEAELGRAVSYVNTAGRAFDTPIGDILVHVALHGQYHRGKVNLLLRQVDQEPTPVDFIAFVRGVPAATTGSPLTSESRAPGG